MLEYKKILNKNIINVFKDILQDIKKNGLSNGNHLYVTFITKHKNVKIPNWLLDKYQDEMTIVIQYEYYNIRINKNFFEIELSFNKNIVNLKIGYDALVSFADPSVNFGLKLQDSNKIKKSNLNFENKKIKNKNNVIDFSDFKKKLD